VTGAGSPAAYGIALALGRLVARWVFGFRFEVRGAEHLPRAASGQLEGGWIAAALPHRRWIDPFLLALALPARPRLVFLGDARAIYRSPIRRLLFRVIGGVVPISPRGGASAFGEHVAAAAAVIDRGHVFALFPERGPASPPGRGRPIARGVGYIGLRTGALIVPMVIGGNEELYRGRRLVLSILPPATASELAALDGPAPAVESTEERDAAERVAAAIEARTAPQVAQLHDELSHSSVDEPRRWRWLSDWID